MRLILSASLVVVIGLATAGVAGADERIGDKPLHGTDNAFDLRDALLQQVKQLFRSRAGIVSYARMHEILPVF